jgi:hypothetical protein
MMAKSGSATIVKRGANEKGLDMGANVVISPGRKQRSVNGDYRRSKAIRNFRLSAFP